MTGILVAVILVVFLVALGSGRYEVSGMRVLEILVGQGTRPERYAVLELRLPRALLAIVAGAGLALSGAMFQSLTRNPLGSPDVIGFANGAYAGVVLSILLFGGGRGVVQAGALLGGIVTAVVVYLLAFRRGVHGFRLIIIGIAVSMILSAMTTWLMLRARVDTAMSAAVWGTGSLNGATGADVAQVGISLAVLLPFVAISARSLKALSLGEDTAASLGVRVRWATLGISVLGVALSASAVAVTGLIMFIALAAPQVARRATGTAHVPMITTALMGAALLSLSDWIAQHGLGDRVLPVGVVTVCIGGGYLVWLLIREARRS
ncbi:MULTISPECIES: FecCD family ABC transporter permease [unclassified Microbacterium]|uniref:FecCD family ABC transporter permease n=1 Tax=unclassified Microbacterium TaxID=2609290 RepID=UPI003016C2E8